MKAYIARLLRRTAARLDPPRTVRVSIGDMACTGEYIRGMMRAKDSPDA